MNQPVKRPSKLKKVAWISGLTVVLLLSIFIYFRYYFIYSEGTRVGILYKFSKKGTIFKTFEGEMVLPGIRFKQKTDGISSNMFYFSVTDENLANQLMNSQGMELELHYEYFNRPLPWRGDKYEGEKGQYIVDALIKIKNREPNGYGL